MITNTLVFHAARQAHDARFADLPHYALVQRVVANFKRILPPHVEFDDLFQVGYLALMRAVSTFNGGGSFAGYAALQIRRALIDEQRRSQGRAQRGIPRRREVQIGPETEHADKPPHELSLEQLQRAGYLPLHRAQPDILLSAKLDAALASLTARERRIIIGLYVEELRMADLAPTLGICPSRVGQLHLTAIRKLRARLEAAA